MMKEEGVMQTPRLSDSQSLSDRFPAKPFDYCHAIRVSTKLYIDTFTVDIK